MIKKLLRNTILNLIQFIERIEYRNLELDENDIDKKILDSIDISSKNIEVLTDTGWSKVTHIHKTQPYIIYHIKTSLNKELYCADTHIVFTSKMQEVFVKDLIIG